MKWLLTAMNSQWEQKITAVFVLYVQSGRMISCHFSYILILRARDSDSTRRTENEEFLRPRHLYFWPFSGSKFHFEQFLLFLCSFLENLEKFSGPNAWFSSQSK